MLYNRNLTRKTLLDSPLFNDFWSAAGRTQPSNDYHIEKKEDKTLLYIVAAGFKKENFEITLNDNKLKVTTTKNASCKRKAIHQSFAINKERISLEEIEASYEAGILTLSLAANKNAQLKKTITIQ